MDLERLNSLASHKILPNGVKTYGLYPSVSDTELSIKEIFSISNILDIKRKENFSIDYSEKRKDNFVLIKKKQGDNNKGY